MSTSDLSTIDDTDLAAIRGGLSLDTQRMSRAGDDLSRKTVKYGATFGAGAGAVGGALSTPLCPPIGAILGAGAGTLAGAVVGSMAGKLGGFAFDGAKQIYEQLS